MKKVLAPLVAVAMSLVMSEAPAQVRAEYDRGAGALSRALQRLQTTASVLHVGAHPDDEDSALIAYHARHDHARTAYLSLTRGSGGQNIIGPEISDLLGVIRTEELLQARRLDGAGQYFTRAVDFGFSKQREEGARMWDEERLLGDMVRVIRRFRPTVMVSRWNGSFSDGHGHHQFSGYLAPRAFEAAADLERFPEQIDAGLAPWSVKRLYVGERGASGRLPSDVLTIDTGEPDPVAGRSYYQIGMRGRSQQKTQQMGSLELHGPQYSMLRLAASRTDTAAAATGIFEGIDTSLSAIADLEDAPSSDFVSMLLALERLAANALAAWEPLEPGALVPQLAEGLSLARAAWALARSADARHHLGAKIEEFEHAMLLAAGITVDALANSDTVVPGDTLEVAIRVFELERTGARLSGAGVILPDDWQLEPADLDRLSSERDARRIERPEESLFFRVQVPEDAEPSSPYWLEYARQGAMYDWSGAGDAATEPFAAPLLTAAVDLVVGGESVRVEREVRHRLVDPVRGELRRRIDIVPALTLAPASKLEIIQASADRRRHEVLITATNHAPRPVNGVVSLGAPQGWMLEPREQTVSLPASPASTALSFTVILPEDAPPGDYRLSALATIGGSTYRQSMHEVSYPHIDTHRVYENATTVFNIIDVEVAPIRIGYVMGSGDTVPDALRRLGLDVTLIDDDALTNGNLSQFDTIVIGIRASQTRPAYVAANGRLLEFVRRGGTMIVQYQQPDFAEKNLAPYPVTMDRNVRVVDETAPVTILVPDHPVFNFPNEIVASDFDGWVQERNNYNITGFDRDRYLPLTESHDPGEPESDGGMLYARLGKGHYVFTAYSWFRQLPNGTPGGYRIFANLLSLPAASGSTRGANR